MKRFVFAIAALCFLPAAAVANDTSTSTPSVAADSQPTTAPATAAPATPAAPGTAAPALGPDGKPAQPAQPANALANAVVARTLEEQAKQSGFQVQISLDHWLGMGTFVDMRYYSYLATNLAMVGVYQFGAFGKRFAASATVRATYEYTLPDNATGRRFAPADTRVALAAPAFWRDKDITGIALTPSISAVIPTSPESWNAGLITSLGLGLTASRSIGPVDLRASLSGGRGFFTSPQNSFKPTNPSGRDAQGFLLAACRPGETACAGGTANGLWSASIGGQVQWRATDSLLPYIGYSFFRSWGADLVGSNDPFTPKGVDSNGNPVARSGLTPRDRTSAFIGLSYQVNDHYSLDLGLSTVQLPLTATGLVRFPFFSFGSLADNNTTAYFTFTAGY